VPLAVLSLVSDIHEVLATDEFRQQLPGRLMRLIVRDVAAGRLEIDRHTTVVRHGQDIQQLFQVGPMILAVPPSNGWRHEARQQLGGWFVS